MFISTSNVDPQDVLDQKIGGEVGGMVTLKQPPAPNMANS
jgi:hypothetical protein